jgi:hypothetical protein
MHCTITTLRRTNVIIILIVLFVLLFTVRTGFFRSDDFFHLETTKFDTVSDPITMFTEAERGGHYRPMVKLFFWINFVAFGLQPLGYFATTIALFLLSLYIFHLLARLMLGNSLGAYAAILLFLLQGNTYLYTVNWIGAITNILSSLFVISSLFFYINSMITSHRAKLFYFLSLVCFAFGLLSREIAAILIPVILVYDILFLQSQTYNKMTTIAKRLPYYAPFLALFVLAVLARNAAGARELSGGGSYTFTLKSLLNNIVFYTLQLGFLPVAVLLLTIPSLLLDEPKTRNLKLIAWGLFFAAVAVLPFLLFRWTSPTWLYLPAFGTTLAAAVLSQQVFSSDSKRATLLLYGVLFWALIGNLLLFAELSSNRWWQWGRYTKNVIEEVETQYPDLPQGATLYFIDGNEQEMFGIKGLFRGRYNLNGAFRVWYDDPSLQAYILDETNSIEAALKERGDEGTSPIFAFEYNEGSIIDKTKWVQELGE